MQEALRRADQEGRARADKAAEAKRVVASIAGLRAEMGKIEEQLAECQRCVRLLGAWLRLRLRQEAWRPGAC